jgi:hypothetical protein
MRSRCISSAERHLNRKPASVAPHPLELQTPPDAARLVCIREAEGGSVPVAIVNRSDQLHQIPSQGSLSGYTEELLRPPVPVGHVPG